MGILAVKPMMQMDAAFLQSHPAIVAPHGQGSIDGLLTLTLTLKGTNGLLRQVHDLQ